MITLLIWPELIMENKTNILRIYEFVLNNISFILMIYVTKKKYKSIDPRNPNKNEGIWTPPI